MTMRSRNSRYETERRQKSQRARSHYARVQHRKATRAQRRAILCSVFAVAFGTGFFAGNGHSEAWLAQLETPDQRVERISVLGSSRISASEIAERSGIDRSASLEQVDLEEATRRIEAHPWLRSANLRRLPGGDVLAIVDERSAIAVLGDAEGEAWRAIDSDGTAFIAIDPADHPDLLRLHSSASAPSARDVSSAIELARRVEAAGIARPAAIVLPGGDDGAPDEVSALGWRLWLADGGPEVVLGEEPTAIHLSQLAELLAAQLDAVRSSERIDLRFRDRAILRAADEPPADEASAPVEENDRADESARANDLGERPASA